MELIDVSTATPEQLLRAQTKYLQEIHAELMRRKQEEQRTRILRWIWTGLKYALILGAAWYFAHTVNIAIQNIQNAVPKLPEISLPSFR